MICTDEKFSDLFPDQCQPAESLVRLALVAVMQFVEGLPDLTGTGLRSTGISPFATLATRAFHQQKPTLRDC